MGCGPNPAPVRQLTPDEKRAKERRETATMWMMGGVFGIIVLMGLGQTALHVKAWRDAAARPKEPWELS